MRATRATVNVMRSTCYQNKKLGLQMVWPLNAGTQIYDKLLGKILWFI